MPKDKLFKQMSKDALIDTFHEMFFHELDSWFSADIACCDNCYDEFINKWPAVYTRGLEFQKNGIDLRSFYYGTYLQDIFTKDEFNEFISLIHCPRCGNPLYANMWPYNMKFDLPDNFESILEEISGMAKRTPFLILSHSFAQETYKEIKRRGKEVNSGILDKNYFRARRRQEGKKYENNDFKYPPRNKIEEGRYNHAGNPVIYLADSPTTCFYELRRPKEGLAIAEVKIRKPIKILDLIEIGDSWSSILNAAAWSSLMSSPEEGEGWYRPQYIFTRLIADCAIDAGLDGLRYPSVRLGERSNLVILNGLEAWEGIDIIDIRISTDSELEEQILKSFKFK